MTATSTGRETAARALFRRAGFDVESVPWIRRRDDEFMAIKVWQHRDAAKVLRFITQPEARKSVRLTRIHVGRYEVRFYVAFAEQPPAPHMSYQAMAARTALIADAKSKAEAARRCRAADRAGVMGGAL